MNASKPNSPACVVCEQPAKEGFGAPYEVVPENEKKPIMPRRQIWLQICSDCMERYNMGPVPNWNYHLDANATHLVNKRDPETIIPINR